ncbi:hypothetical protein niasHS_005874 [Heterodera schachtii]|uniref:Uncharacterized protein n=2 Tax=Heterodera TaxID=34509 RepID=A0ABD2JMF8_9BILA
MNALKKLLGGGGKKKGKREEEKQRDKSEDEGEHIATDFDKTFEEAAKKTSATVPQIINYRGSPSRTNRSKSPSPYQCRITTQQQQPKQQQHPIKKVSSAVANRTPTRIRKGSAPGAYKLLGDAKSATPEKDLMRRKMTESQQKRAKDIVESLDWIKPAEESTNPIIAKTESICPQVHLCEMISLPRADQWAVAVIPQRQLTPLPVPLAASGKLHVSLTNNR